MLLSEIKPVSLTEASVQSVSTVRDIIRSNFARRGFGVALSGHSKGRATQGDRGEDVNEARLLEAFSIILRLYDKKDNKMMALLEVARRRSTNVQVVFKYAHDNTYTNIPCVIIPDPSKKAGFAFLIKTIMVKPDFKPHSTHDIVYVLPEL